MFDPARDDDHGSQSFYRRLVIVMTVGVVAAIALWPSISGFSVGPDATHPCLALRDAFHASASGVTPDEPDCGPEARHRIIVTGIGLGIVGVAIGTAAVARSKRERETNLRHKPG